MAPVPATVPPPVMLSVPVPPVDALLPPTFRTPVSPPMRTEPPVVTVIVAVAPALMPNAREGSELSVVGSDRAPTIVRLPPSLIVAVAVLFALRRDDQPCLATAGEVARNVPARSGADDRERCR